MFKTDKSQWLSFFSTEIGSNLTRVHHLYYYADFDTRDKVRAAVAADSRWTDYLKLVKPHMVNQSSLIYVEATATLTAAGLKGAVPIRNEPDVPTTASSGVCYEMRRYQLKLGYPTVPEFLKYYGEGLQDKLRVDQTGASRLVTLLYNEVGPLNTVIELWRHQTMQRSQDSRVASREAALWKKAVVLLWRALVALLPLLCLPQLGTHSRTLTNSSKQKHPLWIAHFVKMLQARNAELGITFDNQFLRPAAFSPWQ